MYCIVFFCRRRDEIFGFVVEESKRGDNFQRGRIKLGRNYEPFLVIAPIFYSLKIPRNQKFSVIVICYKMGIRFVSRLVSSFRLI